MKYPTGEIVHPGDKVTLGSSTTGVVVCSIDTREYSRNYPEAAWAYLEEGVLIESPELGLVHRAQPETELGLLERV